MNLNKEERQIKKIAVMGSPETKKQLVEWAYFNSSILRNLCITANAGTAGILAATLHTPVIQFDLNDPGNTSELALAIQKGDTDAVIFFENPIRLAENNKAMLKVMELIMERDIPVAYGDKSRSKMMELLVAQGELMAPDPVLPADHIKRPGAQIKNTLSFTKKTGQVLYLLTRKIALLV